MKTSVLSTNCIIFSLGSKIDEPMSMVSLQELCKQQQVIMYEIDLQLSGCVDEFRTSVLSAIKEQRKRRTSNTKR